MVLVCLRLHVGPARNADDKVARRKFTLLVLRRVIATLTTSNSVLM